MKSALYSAVSALGFASLSPVMLAQGTDEPALVQNTVTVTVQKREQALKDVPVAVSALDAEFLDNLGLDEFDAVARFVPGFEVQEQSPNNPGFVIRGITSDSGEANIEPRIAVFQDGVSISRSRGSIVELFDMERIEVAKGPQPTLFGRGALIGGVNIIQAKAQFDFGASLEAGTLTIDFGTWDSADPAVFAPDVGRSPVTLTIDGFAVTVPEGTSVMRAAALAGLSIPKLCATDSLEAFGSCRLCVVEIEGRRGSPASCTTPVAPGMVVRTQSDKVRRIRKGVMGEEGELGSILPHSQQKIHQRLGLIRQPLNGWFIDLLEPDTGMLVVVDHDLVSAVAVALKVPGVRGMYPHQRVEGLRHRRDVYRSAQRDCEADEILRLRVELLADRQIPDRR